MLRIISQTPVSASACHTDYADEREIGMTAGEILMIVIMAAMLRAAKQIIQRRNFKQQAEMEDSDVRRTLPRNNNGVLRGSYRLRDRLR